MKRLIAGLLPVVVLLALLAPAVISASPAPSRPAWGTSQTGGEIIATIKADRLNVRRIPDTLGSVLGILTRDERVQAVGRDRVSAWLEVVTPFGVGWVSARYISASDTILKLPVTEDLIPPFATVTTSPSVLVRAGPQREYPTVANVPLGTELDVIGLHRDNTYVQVETEGGVGWVSLQVVAVTGNVNALRTTDREAPALAQINAYRVRVRTAPNTSAPIIARVRLGERYFLRDQDELGNWYLIEGDFGLGWISARHVLVIGYLAAPWDQ